MCTTSSPACVSAWHRCSTRPFRPEMSRLFSASLSTFSFPSDPTKHCYTIVRAVARDEESRCCVICRLEISVCFSGDLWGPLFLCMTLSLWVCHDSSSVLNILSPNVGSLLFLQIASRSIQWRVSRRKHDPLCTCLPTRVGRGRHCHTQCPIAQRKSVRHFHVQWNLL